ncbi:DNA-binding domain-containing protein [Hoeflea olei]|nr:DNA-binding domain-containing protein [Hoeflea olei]
MRPAAQSLFAAALIDPERPLPEGITAARGKAADRRFAVYRNTVTVTRIDALAAIFPAIERLVGQEAFRSLARLHLVEEPPASPVLFEYGAGFAALLERTEPLRPYPYLADVARLERAWLDAVHAEDALPLDPTALGAIPQERLNDVIFTAHPATRIVESRFAAVSIFSASRGHRPLDGIRPQEPEDGLVTRPGHTVEVRRLAPGAAPFLKALIRGETLAAAASHTLASHPGFALPAALSVLLEAGVFTACTLLPARME